MKSCPSCGSKVSDAASYCFSCGSSIPSTGLEGVPVVYDRGARDTDARALGKVRLFVMLYGLEIVFGIASGIVVLALLAGIAGSPPGLSLRDVLYGSAGVFGVVVGVGVLGLYQLRAALRTLSALDSERFSVPSTLTLVLLFAEPILFVGAVVAVGGLVTGTVPLQGGGDSTALVQNFLTASGLALIAGSAVYSIAELATLVGTLGGPVLGLWRMGSRYAEDDIKAGAVLYIIPLVQVIAPLLLWFGVSKARRKVESAIPQPASPNP